MKKVLLVWVLVILTGCATGQKMEWVNDVYLARGVDHSAAYRSDNSECWYKADSQFGSAPPNGSYAAQTKCSGAGSGGAIACGIRLAEEDSRWEKARNNARNNCLYRKGWELRQIHVEDNR